MRKEFLLKLAVVGVAACAAVFAFASIDPESTSLFASNDHTEFIQYAAKYGKNYGTKEEFEFRYQLFLKSKAEIEASNSIKGVSFFLTTN
jgi:hypothetical protein